MTACWAGTSSPFEQRLMSPLPTYGLESLRLRFMNVVVSNHAMNKAARAILQMAFETELRAVVTKLVPLAADVMRSNVCERRRFIDVDVDMRRMSFLVEPALTELASAPGAPPAYVDLLRRYAASDYPRYRACALATTICFAAAVLVP